MGSVVWGLGLVIGSTLAGGRLSTGLMDEEEESTGSLEAVVVNVVVVVVVLVVDDEGVVEGGVVVLLPNSEVDPEDELLTELVSGNG